MSSWIDGAWTLLGDASLKAALVVAAAWIALAVGRPRNASVRHGVWTAALGAMLALPWLTLIAPRVSAPAGWYPRWSAAAASGAAADRELKVTRDVIPIPIALTDGSAVVGERNPSNPPTASFERAPGSVAAPPNIAPQAASSSSAAAPSASAASASVERADSNLVDLAKVALVTVYLAVASVLVVRLAAGLWATRRIVARARAAATPLAEELLPAGTRLLESHDVVVPVATGLWRPAVLLPADWRSWGEPLLRCVLAHEAAHVRRRDPWVAALAALNRAAYWFHPAAWLVERRLAALAEQVCDDAVIEATGQRAGYARELVAMAARVTRKLPRVAPAGVAMARRASVEDRVTAIVDEARPLARRMGWRRVAVLAAVAAPMVVMAAGLQAQVAKPQAEDAKPQAAEADAAGEQSEVETEPVLSGRLVDETGAPVTDARVSLMGPDYFDTKVDAGGGYSFDAIKQAGEYRLHIETQRWLGFNRMNVLPQLVLEPGKAVLRDFTLPRACMIRVRVVDELGQPVGGVSVLPMPANIETRDWPNGLNHHGAGSNKDGWAEVGVPPSKEPYHLAAMSDDYAFSRIELTVDDPSVLTMESITVTPGVEVRGTAICSDGKPAAGWGVQVQPIWWNFMSMPNNAPIGEDGSFTLPHVAPGRYHVSLSVPTGEGMSRVSRILSDVELPPPGGVLELKLNEPSPQSMGAIAGRVRFVGGESKEHVSITAVPEAGGQLASSHVAGGGRSFRIAPVPPGRYRVRFSSPDIEEKEIAGVTAPVDDLEVELQVVGRPTLRGRVTLTDGAAPPRFRMRAEKVRTLRGPNYIPDAAWREAESAAGEFEIDVPGPGVYRLAVEAEGYAPARSEEINTDVYDGKAVPLELNAGARLIGQVVDEHGAPIAGASVMPLTGVAASRDRRDVDVEALSVKTDADGAFTLERLAPGSEWLRAEHPDYALTIVQDVALTAGANRIEPIVMQRGGTVRGRVFDAEGRPQSGVQLSIRNRSGWNETAMEKLNGEYAVVTTDAEGRYEAHHLPDSLCYVVRSDYWSSLGTVLQAFLPTDGGEATLDLGGEAAVRGRLLVNGAPLASTRIQLGDQPHFGAFKAYAITDGEGRFAFWSPPPGARKLYYEAPGKRNDWVLASQETIGAQSGDLGDVDVRTSTVAITVQGLSAEDKVAARMMLQTYNPIWPHGDDGGMPAPRASDGDPFTFVNVLPGEYEASCIRRDGVVLSQRVTVPASGEPVAATLIWPVGDASITGPIDENICGPGGCNPPNLWSKDGSIRAVLAPREGNRFEISGLPAGEYYLANFDTRNAPPALEFTLGANERKTLNLSDGSYVPTTVKEGVLQVMCYTAEGTPLPGCEIALVTAGQTLRPHSAQEGRVVIMGPAGTYRMTASFPGMGPVEREVTLVPVAPDGRPEGEYSVDLRMRAAP